MLKRTGEEKMVTLTETLPTTLSPLVDENVLDEFIKFMGDEGADLARDLIDMYLKNSPKMLDSIHADLRTNNVDQLKTHIHTLKGSSAQLGVVGVASLCRSIEDVILEGRFSELDDLISQLDETYSKVTDYYSQRQ
jgi:HPt (histidine-containing phosphotransfer) domain-containing protein